MKNRLESVIEEIYHELRKQNPDYCACELCRSDVLAFALNHSRPRYSGGTTTGQALISVELQKDQTRAELAVIVLDAMRRVAATPRHGKG
jgi:competence protein ComFB